jgi:prevent-host-death family protein
MATFHETLSKPKARQGGNLTKTAFRRRANLEKSMPASSAKTHLLELLDTVHRTREALLITKRGRPVARLVPVDTKPAGSIFGCMKGTFRITGDIVSPEPDVWEAML